MGEIWVKCPKTDKKVGIPKRIVIKCPHCGETHEIRIEVIDYGCFC